jgi:hypothetical protein
MHPDNHPMAMPDEVTFQTSGRTYVAGARGPVGVATARYRSSPSRALGVDRGVDRYTGHRGQLLGTAWTRGPASPSWAGSSPMAEPPLHVFGGRQGSAALGRSMSPMRTRSTSVFAKSSSSPMCCAASWAAFLLG